MDCSKVTFSSSLKLIGRRVCFEGLFCRKSQDKRKTGDECLSPEKNRCVIKITTRFVIYMQLSYIRNMYPLTSKRLLLNLSNTASGDEIIRLLFFHTQFYIAFFPILILIILFQRYNNVVLVRVQCVTAAAFRVSNIKGKKKTRFYYFEIVWKPLGGFRELLFLTIKLSWYTLYNVCVRLACGQSDSLGKWPPCSKHSIDNINLNLRSIADT